MVINSPCLNDKKELAIPEQTANRDDMLLSGNNLNDMGVMLRHFLCQYSVAFGARGKGVVRCGSGAVIQGSWFRWCREFIPLEMKSLQISYTFVPDLSARYQDSVNNPDEHDQSNVACDDLDFFDGGSDDELFINKCQKEYFEGGGWIPTNSGEINYDSERTISDSHRRSTEFILNIPVNSHSTSPVTASNHKRKSHFEERSQKVVADKVANVDLGEAASGLAPCERYVCSVPDSSFDSSNKTSP
ncbi:hypothetical protein Tco_0816596 [Tanacetum coccineum]